MARAVLRKIITDAQTGQAYIIRNLPELLLPPVLQLPDCRDLESNTERRSAQFLGKPEQKRGSGWRSFFSLFSRLATVGASPFFKPTRAFMAPIAATASTSVSRSWRVSRLSSQIRVFRLSISLFSPGSVTFILCSCSLCGGDQSRLSFTWTVTGRPASKQV